MIFVLLVLSLLNVALVHAQGLTQTEFVKASMNAGAISHSPVGVTGSPMMSTSIAQRHQVSWWNRPYAADPMFAGDS